MIWKTTSAAGIPVGAFLTAPIAFLILAAVVYFFVVTPYTKAKEQFFPTPPSPRAPPRTSRSCTEIRDALVARGGGVPRPSETPRSVAVVRRHVAPQPRVAVRRRRSRLVVPVVAGVLREHVAEDPRGGDGVAPRSRRGLVAVVAGLTADDLQPSRLEPRGANSSCRGAQPVVAPKAGADPQRPGQRLEPGPAEAGHQRADERRASRPTARRSPPRGRPAAPARRRRCRRRDGASRAASTAVADVVAVDDVGVARRACPTPTGRPVAAARSDQRVLPRSPSDEPHPQHDARRGTARRSPGPPPRRRTRLGRGGTHTGERSVTQSLPWSAYTNDDAGARRGAPRRHGRPRPGDRVPSERQRSKVRQARLARSPKPSGCWPAQVRPPRRSAVERRAEGVQSSSAAAGVAPRTTSCPASGEPGRAAAHDRQRARLRPSRLTRPLSPLRPVGQSSDNGSITASQPYQRRRRQSCGDAGARREDLTPRDTSGTTPVGVSSAQRPVELDGPRRDGVPAELRRPPAPPGLAHRRAPGRVGRRAR